MTNNFFQSFENETLAQHISKQFKDPANGGTLIRSSIYLDINNQKKNGGTKYATANIFIHDTSK